MSEYLSPDEAADLLGKSPATLARWRGDGVGPSYIKLGHSIRYRRADLDEFMRASRVETDRTMRVSREVRRYG